MVRKAVLGTAAAVVVVVLLVGSAVHAADTGSDICGLFAVEGVNPDGKLYTGTVEITQRGNAYAMTWSIANQTYRGVALRQGDVLSASWQVGGGKAGVVVYRIRNRGTKLAGEWIMPVDNTVHVEVLNLIER